MDSGGGSKNKVTFRLRSLGWLQIPTFIDQRSGHLKPAASDNNQPTIRPTAQQPTKHTLWSVQASVPTYLPEPNLWKTYMRIGMDTVLPLRAGLSRMSSIWKATTISDLL